MRRRRPDRGRPELLGDHLELRRGGLRGREVAERLRDLGLRREQPGSRELVPRDLFEAALDRGRRGVRATSRQEQERLPRLRLRSERLGLPEGVLRTLEVAHAEPDLSQLVERLSRHRGMEALQLVRCPLRLRGGVGPRTGESHELGPMDAADPREAADVLPFAPALRHLGPLGAAPIVRGLAAHRHHRAEHRAGRERAQLAAHGDRRGPLHQAERFVEPPGRPQHLRAADRDPDGEVGIVQPRGDLLRAIQVRERSLEVPAVEVELTVCDLEVAVRDGFRLPLEEVLRAVQPRLRHGAGHLRPVLPAERERHHRGHRAVPPLEVERVGALERRDRLRREPDPPRGLRQRLEVPGLEAPLAIRLLQQSVGLRPGTTRVRLAAFLQRIDGHGVTHRPPSSRMGTHSRKPVLSIDGVRALARAAAGPRPRPGVRHPGDRAGRRRAGRARGTPPRHREEARRARDLRCSDPRGARRARSRRRHLGARDRGAGHGPTRASRSRSRSPRGWPRG